MTMKGRLSSITFRGDIHRGANTEISIAELRFA